jgi:DNA-binding CsgD family transcriptional regulator
MKGQRQELAGQRAGLDRLRGRGTGPALVRGPAGSGKTTLVRRHLAETAEPAVELGPGAAWDEFRAAALLAAVRAGFESFSGVPRLAEAVEAVGALCVPASYATPAGRHRLLGALAALLGRLRERTRLVVVFDAADDLPAAALVPVHRAGHSAIACAVRAPELAALAEVVVDLAPLDDDDAGRLLRQVAAAPVDDAAVGALRTGLGALYGNPGTLVSTVESLKASGGLAKVHGVLALRAAVALPAGHRLLAEVDALGEVGRLLVRLAADAPGIRVDDIPALAAATGHAQHVWGHAVDRLVPAGALAHDEHGRLSCPVPALGAVAADADALARSVAAVGTARPRATGSPFAVGSADRAGVECSEAIRHLISTADYAGLAAFTADPARDGSREELAAGAALAALHLGRPIPAAARSALDGAATDLARRWFSRRDGVAAISAADVAAALRPLGRRAAPAESTENTHDLVPVLRAVLGPLYRLPADGPIAAYHRVRGGYADGDWAGALSAARDLELHHPDLPITDAARLLAAEICGWRGEDRQAASWLAAVGEDTPFPGLRGWVATGLREHAGEDAFTCGWKWYTEHRARLEEPGAARLLTRLAAVATDTYGARAVQRETEARCGRTSGTGLLVRGIVEADPACVRAAERVIRARGDRFELAVTCLGLARISAEPRPWLSEAYELASAMGAVKLVSTAKRTMAGRGVEVPARRSRGARAGAPEMSEVELRIVELIRSGKTNRQIAVALRVSAKTVEKHLTRLFAKAGCRTRHGLATSGLGAELVGA